MSLSNKLSSVSTLLLAAIGALHGATTARTRRLPFDDDARGGVTRTVLAWATSVSCSLVIMKWVGRRVMEHRQSSEQDSGNLQAVLYKDVQNKLRLWYELLEGLLQRTKRTTTRLYNRQKGLFLDLTVVKHSGSCHCQAVQFHITAPKTLFIKERDGKIQYPQTTVRANKFKLLHGKRFLRNYLCPLSQDDSSSSNTTTTTQAHTFCSHCGVPICSALNNAGSDSLLLNVNCLDSPWIRNDGDPVDAAAAASASTKQASLFLTPTKGNKGKKRGNGTAEKKDLNKTDNILKAVNTNKQGLFSPTKTGCLQAVSSRLLSCGGGGGGNSTSTSATAPSSPPTAKTLEWPSDSLTESTSTDTDWSSQQESLDTAAGSSSEYNTRIQLRRFMGKHLKPEQH